MRRYNLSFVTKFHGKRNRRHPLGHQQEQGLCWRCCGIKKRTKRERLIISRSAVVTSSLEKFISSLFYFHSKFLFSETKFYSPSVSAHCLIMTKGKTIIFWEIERKRKFHFAQLATQRRDAIHFGPPKKWLVITRVVVVQLRLLCFSLSYSLHPPAAPPQSTSVVVVLCANFSIFSA